MAATLVQQALLSANGGAATLSATPAAGNLLLAFVTQFGAAGAAQNGYTLLNSYSGTDDTLYVLAKVATSGDTTSQDPLTNSAAAGRNLAVLEIAGWNSGGGLAGLTVVDAKGETGTASMTLSNTNLHPYASFFGAFASTGSNTLPAITDGGNPALGSSATIQGTSTSATPRAISTFYLTQARANFQMVLFGPHLNLSANWGSTVNGYGAFVQVDPGPLPPDLEISEQSGMLALLQTGFVVSEQSGMAAMLLPGLVVSEQSAYIALLQNPAVTTPAAGSASASATAVGGASVFNPKLISGTASAAASASGGLIGYQSRGAGNAFASAQAQGAVVARSTIGRGNASASATAAGAGMTYRRAGGGVASATAVATGAGIAIRNVGYGVASAKAQAQGVGSFRATIGAGSASAAATASGVMTASLASGGTLYGASVTERVTFQAATSNKIGVRVQLLEALQVTSPLDAHVVFTITERVRFSLQQSLNQRLQVSLSAGVRLKDSLLRTLRGVLTDTVHISISMQDKQVLQLLDRIGVLSTLSVKATYLRSIRDAVRFKDTLLRALGLEISDSITAHDTSLVQLMAMIGLQETVTFDEILTPVWMLAAKVADTVVLDEAWFAKAVFNAEISDIIELVGGMLDANGDLSVWAMNTRTAAVTEYQNYPFNSFARLGPQQYIGAADDGLYELNGEDDEGEDIIAVIRSGFLQFGGTHLSRLKEAYIAMRGEGKFLLKICTAAGEEYVYQTCTRSMVNTKVGMGKGQRARYFAFELISSGQDFDLDTIEFVPIVMQRRI